MDEPEVLQSEQVRNILELAVERKLLGVMTHLSKSKWHMTKVLFSRINGHTVQIEIAAKEKPHPINIQIDQPVGISFKHDFSKYLMESVVVGFEPSINQACGGKIVLEMPDRIDRMQRRAYFRVSVPKELNVKAIFWHRGYNDDRAEVPVENYWQGRLVDLSAGGVQIAVELEQGPNFRTGQLVGLQFTPMPYEKPILVEGQVRHIAEAEDGRKLYIGIQFIGVEATGEGREKLRRISETVNKYREKEKTCPAI